MNKLKEKFLMHKKLIKKLIKNYNKIPEDIRFYFRPELKISTIDSGDNFYVAKLLITPAGGIICLLPDKIGKEVMVKNMIGTVKI